MRRILLTGLVALTLALSASAEIIFLKDGRLLHVKVLSGNDRGVEVERLDNHGKLFIRWELLRPEDRKELRVRFGLEEDDSGADLVMEGHRVYVRRGDYYDGLIEERTQDAITLRREGKTVTFLSEAVRRIEERTVSVFDVYTPEELYERRLQELNPSDGDVVGHFEMAKWATKVGLYGKALDHYARVREIDPEFKSEYVANQIGRLEILDKNKEIRDAIALAEKMGRRNRYKECLGYLDEVLAVPDLDRSLRAEVERKKERFEKRRWEYFRKLVERDYHRLVNRKITELSRSRDIKARAEEKRLTIDKAMTYLRTKLHKEIVEELAARYELDPKKEVEEMWEQRTSRIRRTSSYGSGTFIVEGRAGGNQGERNDRNRQVRELIERIRRRGRRGRQQQQEQVQQKLITKDQWWKRADSVMRSFWMRAYYAEKGRQFEVTNTTWRTCQTCGGTGTIKKLASQGGFQKVTCPRCHGHKGDKVVTYR